MEKIKSGDEYLELRSEEELLNAFRPRDRKLVEIPSDMTFPLMVSHYLAWTEPSQARVFLLFKRPAWKAPLAVSFRRTHSSGGGGGMCDWCHSVGSSDQVGLLSMHVDPNTSLGFMLCLDLGCINRLETVSAISGKDFGKLSKNLIDKISRFFENNLKIESEPVH